jgi:hypothetical protein
MEHVNSSSFFPVEVFSLVPITFVFVVLVSEADPRLRFGIFYPVMVFVLGVLIPLYIIVKNKKMKSLLSEIIFKKPKKNLLDLLSLMKQSCSKSVTPIVVNQ